MSAADFDPERDPALLAAAARLWTVVAMIRCRHVLERAIRQREESDRRIERHGWRLDPAHGPEAWETQ
jgi:hypothetical protein